MVSFTLYIKYPKLMYTYISEPDGQYMCDAVLHPRATISETLHKAWFAIAWVHWRRADTKRPPEEKWGDVQTRSTQLMCRYMVGALHLAPEEGSSQIPFPSVVVAVWLQFTFSSAGQGYSCVWGMFLLISPYASPHLSRFLRLCSLNCWHYSKVNIFREFISSPSWDLCFDWDLCFSSSGWLRVKALHQLKNNNTSKK